MHIEAGTLETCPTLAANAQLPPPLRGLALMHCDNCEAPIPGDHIHLVGEFRTDGVCSEGCAIAYVQRCFEFLGELEGLEGDV